MTADELHALLEQPWSQATKDAVEAHYGLPLSKWPMNGTPGPFAVDLQEHAETVVFQYAFFPQWNTGKPEPTGYVDRNISIVRRQKGAQ